jgi:hypothetical protein
MRTQLLILAATLTFVGFTTTSVAATSGGASSGGGASGGGVSAPSGGGGSSGMSGGGSGSGSSHGGAGGGGGGAHGGASAGRGGQSGGGHFNGYGNSAAHVADMAHGGYRVLDTRPGNVMVTTTLSNHIVHDPLVLGPALGSAAKAALMNDKRRGPTGGAPPRHPHRPRRGRPFEYTECSQTGCEMPVELCLRFYDRDGGHYDMNTSLDCPPPRKLTP